MPRRSRNLFLQFLPYVAIVGVILVIACALYAYNASNIVTDNTRRKKLPGRDNQAKRAHKFKTAIHAFMSLVSMEKNGCELLSASDDDCYTCLTRDYDPGWEPNEFQQLFQRIVPDIEGLSRDEEVFLKQWLVHSQRCSKFYKSDNQRHISLINRYLTQSDWVIYPWGADEHCVYIELHKIQSNDYRITIFDLGAGRRLNRKYYKPIEYDQLSRREFDDKIRALAHSYGQPGALNALVRRNDVPETECVSCLPERSQTTGNCVVKNFLAAMQQDAVDSYGYDKGLRIFSNVYIALLRACLLRADKFASRHFVTQLPHFDELCKLVDKCQIAFSGNAKQLLKTLEKQYDRVRASCTRYNAAANNDVCSIANVPTQGVLTNLHSSRETGLRRNGQDSIDILVFLRGLRDTLDPWSNVDSPTIPASLRCSDHRYVDSHQEQHLAKGDKRPGKSIFYPAIATSPHSPTINALASTVNKLVSEYCRIHNIRRSQAITENFTVDLGFDIGSIRGRKDVQTSCVKIDGYTGSSYHIFPVPEDEKGIRIIASDLLGEPVVPPRYAREYAAYEN